jgi:hypothetical protein
MDELIKYVRALVYLQAQSMVVEGSTAQADFLLSKAGLSHREIGEILGRTEQAIAKSVSRARAARKGKK